MSDNNQRWRKLMLPMTVAYSLAALIWAYIHPYVAPRKLGVADEADHTTTRFKAPE